MSELLLVAIVGLAVQFIYTFVVPNLTVSEQVKNFVEQAGEPYPLVVSGDTKNDLKVVMNKDELGSCGGDAQKFVAMLRQKGVLGS